MKFGEHLSTAFWYGLSWGFLAYMGLYLGTYAINIMNGSQVLPPTGMGLLGLGFGFLTSMGIANAKHAKGE